MLNIPQSIFIGLISLFGLCIGSFINVLVWRLPRESKISGRSQCPYCHTTLTWYNLVPLLSFIAQRGRCRFCNQAISIRYPLIELVSGIAFAIFAAHFFPANLVEGVVLLKALFIVSLCIAIFIIDFEHYLILDVLVFPGIVGVLVLNVLIDVLSRVSLLSWASTSASGVLGALVAAVPFWLLWVISKGKWMGFGDVKYAIFMGLALGFTSTVVGLFLAFTIGAVVGLGLMASGKKQLSSKVPFGTFLTIATFLSLLWGPALWQAYALLIGI